MSLFPLAGVARHRVARVSARASRTAELAALARAANHRESPDVRGPDALALHFLSPVLRTVARCGPLLGLYKAVLRRGMPGTYGFVLARTRFIDDVVVQEIEAGTQQLVILGAGFDTRAYRFSELLLAAGALVFEIDAPATSALKQDRTRRALGALPEHVRYVSADFNRDDIAAVAARAGLDRGRRTTFVWEGVTFYVDAPAVDAVLRLVTQFSPGSGIVLDYLSASIVDGTSHVYGAQRARAFVARRGEPFTFGIADGHVREYLAARGLDLVSECHAGDMEQRYLQRDNGSRLGRVAPFYHLAYARRAP